MTKPPSARRFVALWFPLLAVNRLYRTPSPALPEPGAPLLIVHKQRGALVVTAANRAALALGLAPGLPLADARARVPDVLVHPADPVADRAWLKQLADACQRYTPQVALDGPDGLLLDISGCAHLFGGEAALALDLRARLAACGMDVRLACAAGPAAAAALARFAAVLRDDGGFADEAAVLRGLPLAALGLDSESRNALARAGMRTLGDVAAVPSPALAARFGAGAVLALQRLFAQAPAPLLAERRAAPLLVERRFAEPVARSDFVLQALGQLAEAAGAELMARAQGGRRFEAQLYRSDGLRQTLSVGTSRPLREPALIRRLFDERLAALADPLDPGFGYDLLRLAVPVVEPLAATQLALDGGSVGESEVAALIDRLSARLGPTRVRRFVPGNSHIPERAGLDLPVAEAATPAPWPAPMPGEPPLRPLHLFDPPQRIEVLAEVPDGPPRRFRWRRTQHDVVRAEGPERIAGEWWRSASGRTLTRDYYRVEDAFGRRFWLFRHGLFGSEKAMPHWYVHGLFA